MMAEPVRNLNNNELYQIQAISHEKFINLNNLNVIYCMIYQPMFQFLNPEEFRIAKNYQLHPHWHTSFTPLGIPIATP